MSSMAKGRSFVRGALLALALLLAPGMRDAGRSATAQPTDEATAGQWRTIVIASGNAHTVPAPPADDAAATARELAELHVLQAHRTPATDAQVQLWNHAAVARWNQVARGLVTVHNTATPLAARAYALLSVAQYDALVTVWANKTRYQRRPPSAVDPSLHPLLEVSDESSYPDEQAALAASAYAVLSWLYPRDAAALAQLARAETESRLWAGASYRSDLDAGEQLGRQVAQQVIAYAKTDGSDAVWTGTVPVGPGRWYSSATPPELPMLPLWGQVRPWLMSSGWQFRPSPPPPLSSPDYQAALQEVRRISDHRTPAQIAIAQFWADGNGTATPPGHWNAIASELIREHGLSELRAARALALMNMAEMDAGISCWDAKYTYWLIRPSQADPQIITAVPLPNFPSYTSGHATFSGAASAVLGYLFPDQRDRLNAMAQEASISRVYGGIHYRFDSEQGLKAGHAIAQLAIARGMTDGSQ